MFVFLYFFGVVEPGGLDGRPKVRCRGANTNLQDSYHPVSNQGTSVAIAKTT